MKFPLMFRSTHEQRVADARLRIAALNHKVTDLQALLDIADNNDHRNPVTGRYEKEPKL